MENNSYFSSFTYYVTDWKAFFLSKVKSKAFQYSNVN